MKRLFFDIETSQAIVKTWRVGYKLNIDYSRILKDAAIICASFKFEGEPVQHVYWKDGCDKELLEELVPILNSADEVVAHNGDRFDIKWITGRCIYHRLDCYPKYNTVDTLKIAKKHRFPSNKLDSLAKYLNVGAKIKTGGIDLWDRVEEGDEEALSLMLDYCDNDVIVLEKVYEVLMKYAEPKTHLAVMNGGEKWQCPKCESMNMSLNQTRVTTMGTKKRQMKCGSCGGYHTVSNRSYMDFLEWKEDQKRMNL